VTLWRVGAPGEPEAAHARGKDGDFVLSSPPLDVIVSGDTDESQRRISKGSVVGAIVEGIAGSEIRELARAVVVDGKDVAFDAAQVTAAWRAGRPAVRIDEESEDGDLVAVTYVDLVPGKPWAALTTTVTNRGKAPARAVRIGDRVLWPGEATFSPGLGFVYAPTRKEVPWIARRGKRLSFALAFPERPATVDFSFEPHGPWDQVALGGAADLAPQASRTYHRVLVAVPGGLERAAEAAWAAIGVRTARLDGQLKPAPAWATIEAFDPEGGKILAASAGADGSFAMALPAGRYRLLSRSPGGVDTTNVAMDPGRPPLVVEMFPPLPGRLRFRVTEEGGGLVPARLVVRGVSPTPDPVFGPEHTADGAGNLIYTLDGEGESEIPPGRYRVTATHGMEYGLSRHEVEVEQGMGATVRASLRREVSTPGWISADFHLHAAPSPDSSVPLDDRVVSLAAENVEFAVATDHNVITDYAASIARLGAGTRLAAARGVEVTTWNPPVGHFNSWPQPAGAEAPPYAHLTPAELFAHLRAQLPDAVIQVNHPRMTHMIGYFNVAGLDTSTGVAKSAGYSPDFDAIEVVNGMELSDQERIDGNLADWFALLNLGLRYAPTGNSDSHRLSHQVVGYPRTFVRVPDDRPEAIAPEQVAAAVRAGRTMVTTGPFIRLAAGGGGPGDLVRAEGGAIGVKVEVDAADWIDVRKVEVFVNGVQTAEATASSAPGVVRRATLSLKLVLPRDAWIAVVARGDKALTEVLPGTAARPLAFTSPVFVDVDGDGVFSGSAAAAPSSVSVTDASADGSF
jgi:hypothetical protein